MTATKAYNIAVNIVFYWELILILTSAIIFQSALFWNQANVTVNGGKRVH